ncbi:Hypothetical protein NTJ_10722 [Nesidiocoris tenuis]|uniref:Shugoshin C-terminal domain-containing protein n=1 Tax=Nesidiocoris tenuis TaxID=355587 RepID=A0ABN7B416_9HEMI|nr:Hypothetical protein NTJ_10722 [Nesidiocoris tenuis]
MSGNEKPTQSADFQKLYEELAKSYVALTGKNSELYSQLETTKSELSSCLRTIDEQKSALNAINGELIRQKCETGRKLGQMRKYAESVQQIVGRSQSESGVQIWIQQRHEARLNKILEATALIDCIAESCNAQGGTQMVIDADAIESTEKNCPDAHTVKPQRSSQLGDAPGVKLMSPIREEPVISPKKTTVAPCAEKIETVKNTSERDLRPSWFSIPTGQPRTGIPNYQSGRTMLPKRSILGIKRNSDSGKMNSFESDKSRMNIPAGSRSENSFSIKQPLAAAGKLTCIGKPSKSAGIRISRDSSGNSLPTPRTLTRKQSTDRDSFPPQEVALNARKAVDAAGLHRPMPKELDQLISRKASAEVFKPEIGVGEAEIRRNAGESMSDPSRTNNGTSDKFPSESLPVERQISQEAITVEVQAEERRMASIILLASEAESGSNNPSHSQQIRDPEVASLEERSRTQVGSRNDQHIRSYSEVYESCPTNELQMNHRIAKELPLNSEPCIEIPENVLAPIPQNRISSAVDPLMDAASIPDSSSHQLKGLPTENRRENSEDTQGCSPEKRDIPQSFHTEAGTAKDNTEELPEDITPVRPPRRTRKKIENKENNSTRVTRLASKKAISQTPAKNRCDDVLNILETIDCEEIRPLSNAEDANVVRNLDGFPANGSESAGSGAGIRAPKRRPKRRT